MDLLAAIKREERKLERQLSKLQKQFDGLRPQQKHWAAGRAKESLKSKSELCPLLQSKDFKATKARWQNSEPRRKEGAREFDNREVAQVKKRVLSAAPERRFQRQPRRDGRDSGPRRTKGEGCLTR